jgi:hypothetical protein
LKEEEEEEEIDGFLSKWRMAAFKCFLSRERIRAKADIVMMNYDVDMAITEAEPEVHLLKNRNCLFKQYL